MIKTDSRHYNRQTKRDLALEMDLWIKFRGERVTSKYGSGIVTDLDLERVTSKLLRVKIELNGRVRFPLLVKNRQIEGLEKVSK